MNKTLQIVLIVGAVLVIAAGLLVAGFFIGRAAWNWNGYHSGGMMGFFNNNDPDAQFGYGMMNGRGARGMMDSHGYYQDGGSEVPYGHGMMGGGMMGGGMMDGGMMGGYGFATNAEPLSTQESLDAVETYLAELGNDDLVVKEIMIFDYNSYAIIEEESTGIGAFELLIDPTTKNVFPEYGPNMMWNLKYGMHAGNQFGGRGMMGGGMMGGGMMGGDMMDNYGDYFNGDIPEVSADMTVSPQQALEYAQAYLDAHEPGVKVSDEITAFYGYYTIDLEKDGQIVGMLSVNGFNGQVFPHTWHGDFIEMVEVGE